MRLRNDERSTGWVRLLGCFDGNIESLLGDYVYDGNTNRSVAVDTAAMTEALRKLYGEGGLVDELTTGQLRK